MIEVFVSFNRHTKIKELENTLIAWDQTGLEPVAIQVQSQPSKAELHRRVTAENVSKGDYILSIVGYGPVEEDFGSVAEKLLAEELDVGLIEPTCAVQTYTDGNVVVCRKGVVTHWIKPNGSQESDIIHASAHARSVDLAGYRVVHLCPTLHYRPLVGLLPS